MTQAVLYVPRDAAAIAAGADRVARRLASIVETDGRPVTLVRNGSRGLLWLEPLLEVETANGRVAFGPVGTADVATLHDAGLLDTHPEAPLPPALAAHPLHLGATEALPYFAKQQRITFARVGLGDPLSLDTYAATQLSGR